MLKNNDDDDFIIFNQLKLLICYFIASSEK